MLAHRTGSSWEVRAPAKLNLWFEVQARRPDGFHEVNTLMTPIALYDTLRLAPRPDGKILLTCETAAAGVARQLWTDLPTDERNLAFRAVRLLQERAEVKTGAELQLIKRIPATAGLGGGSSDAAAALVAANAAWGLDWSREQLATLAAELGSDVPFFLWGGPALCTGRGERVTAIAGLGQLHFVVLRPPVGLSTAEVYRNCRPADQPAMVEPFLQALQHGNLSQAGELMINRLQESAERLTPVIAHLRKAFSKCEFAGHQMSGSGSSYFGLCRSARHARQIAGRLRQSRLGQVYAASSVRH